jgi:FtsZ-binding cell division protein ZapB
LNKYIDGFKLELEEISEKYDKLAIKFRDCNKENENLKNLKDVTQVQIDNYQQEI